MKLLIASPMDPSAQAALQADHDVVRAEGADQETLTWLVRDREVVVFRSGVALTSDVMDAAPQLRLLIRAGSGIDNLDLEHARRRGIEVVRIPEPSARAVAELAFGLMLALTRNILRADRSWRRGRWVKYELESYLLRDKVLGIVGAGNIGSTVGELGARWGMRPVGCVEYPTRRIAADLARKGIRLAEFDEVVARSDILSLHVPLTESTRNLIDARALRRMKVGSYLVNLSRGGVVDEAALRRELVSEERLLGAALDVHEAEGEGKVSPLADLPNVILTPHIGATTVDTQRDIGRRIIEAIGAFSAADARGDLREVAEGGV